MCCKVAKKTATLVLVNQCSRRRLSLCSGPEEVHTLLWFACTSRDWYKMSALAQNRSSSDFEPTRRVRPVIERSKNGGHPDVTRDKRSTGVKRGRSDGAVQTGPVTCCEAAHGGPCVLCYETAHGGPCDPLLLCGTR